MAWYLPTRGPVFWEELRRRLRGGRGYIVLCAYGAVLMALLLGVAWLVHIGDSPQEWPDFGQRLWWFFFIGQLVIVLLISPGVTATAVSAEREAKTLEHLFLTPLSTISFVLGKFFGAVGQMLIMILSGLPVVAVVFQYGGVTPKEVLLGYALILATGLMYAALGFLASCLFARTTFAVVWAYGFMLIVFAGIPLALIFLSYLNAVFMLSESSWLFSGNWLFVNWQNLEEDPTVWRTIYSMLAWTGGALIASTVLIRRLRGIGPFFHRRVSLTVARQNSRPPVSETAPAE